MFDTIEPMPTNGRGRGRSARIWRGWRTSGSNAQNQGIELAGPVGLLTGLTKSLLKTVPDAELTEHLGCGKHGPLGGGSGETC